MKDKKLLIFAVVLGFIVLLMFVVLAILAIKDAERSKISAINSYDACAAAGYPIRETYPEQCATPDGRTFTRTLSPDEQKNTQPPNSGDNAGTDYYGSSTKGSCKTAGDCIATGCNSEICSAKSEKSRMSICIKPEQPTAKERGYTCGCIDNQCQWAK